MTVFQRPYDLMDILDIYRRPQLDLIPLLRLESPRKKIQKRSKADGNETKMEESKSNETEKVQDTVQESEKNKVHRTVKRAKVFPSANVSSPFASFLQNTAQFMAVDIEESNSAYNFQVDVPGVTRDQISLDLDDNNLFTITTTRCREESSTKLSQKDVGNPVQEGQEINKNMEESKTEVNTQTEAKKNNMSVSNVLQERSYGKMERVFHLGKEVDTDKISATLENGVLNITIPLRKKPPAKKITIN